MKVDFNFQPVTREGSPHIIDCSAATWIQDIMDKRVVTIDGNPDLESRIANDLANTGETELNDQEAEYLQNLIRQLPVDNLLKGQLLQRFPAIG